MAAASRLPVWLCLVGVCACHPARGAEFYAGAGAGTVFTQGVAAQIAVAVRDGIELKYSWWTESGQHNRAIALGYRFSNGGPLSVVLGAAYVRVVDDNLLRHPNAYVEVRYALFKDFSCQASHYSGPGPDRGDNMFLCGMSWHLPARVG